MDIKPPPMCAFDKKRLKKKQQRKRKKEASAKSDNSSFSDILPPPTPKPSIEQLRERLHSKMEIKIDHRTGVENARIQKLRDSFDGKLNIDSLFKKMGLSEPTIKSKILNLIKSGVLRDMASLQSHIIELMKPVSK
jgi:hypothetical protein